MKKPDFPPKENIFPRQFSDFERFAARFRLDFVATERDVVNCHVARESDGLANH